MWLRSIYTTRLPSPRISGLRSPGHSPEITHCQIRSSFSSAVGVPPLHCFLPSPLSSFHSPSCRTALLVLRPTGSPDEKCPRRGRRFSRLRVPAGAWAKLGAPPLCSGSALVHLNGEGPQLPGTPAPGPSPGVQLCSKKRSMRSCLDSCIFSWRTTLHSLEVTLCMWWGLGVAKGTGFGDRQAQGPFSAL